MHPPFLARRGQTAAGDMSKQMQASLTRASGALGQAITGSLSAPMHWGGNLTSGLTTGATYTVSSANISNKYNAAQILGKQ